MPKFIETSVCVSKSFFLIEAVENGTLENGTLGAGLLVRTALAVIIPEGVYMRYMSQRIMVSFLKVNCCEH